ncbi:MAG TPA: amidohydrolase/deacetylase family metallohydrolase [Acetobacteraceae bacterium]|jgi:dihydroorotase|nr:amidohydrolase/deacetylase family metallohydrolase [Acetobacteraceae bacterium]
MRFDLLIKGGEIIDPATGFFGLGDVAVRRDRIAAVAREIPAASAFRVIDAAGLLVTPGLIDLHAHVYHGAGYYGIDADPIGALSGVTSWVDAGSAGAFTLEGLRRHVIERAKVRIAAFVNISCIGLVAWDYELTHLDYCDVELFEMVVNQHRDIVHGVKVRMGATTVGTSGIEPVRRAVEAAERCDLPIMIHIAVPPPGIEEFLPLLRAGDIITHCFTGLPMKLFDDDGRLLDVSRKAIDAGVILDIGHGAGSFAFRTAEAALAAGIQPHAISTDMHQMSVAGPMFDLPTCLSKFLALGLDLREVVAMATASPARILNYEDRGTLREGALADVALFKLHEGAFPLYDNTGAMRTGRQLLANVQTIVGGRVLERPAPTPRAVWAEQWDRGGTNRRMREFQCDLVAKGHTPAQMCGCR